MLTHTPIVFELVTPRSSSRSAFFDVPNAELVHAYDIELDDTGHGWVLARLDVPGHDVGDRSMILK